MLVAHGFRALNLNRIACGTVAANQGMSRLAERLGMRQEGVRRQAVWTDGAYHDIVNLTRLGKPATELVTVVGPICETGDRLGSDRLLPAAKENDVLLIANAGAYGYAMSSNYNLRAPAVEVVI